MEQTSQWKLANEPDANAANKHASMLNALDDWADWIPSKDNLHAVPSTIGQHFSADRVAVCICAD